MTTFPSLAAFYAADVRRERSPEVDFGVMWQGDRGSWPQYRVSWVDLTGEFYALRLGKPESVELLGATAPGDRLTAERVMDGWAELHPSRLGWVRNRLLNERSWPVAEGDHQPFPHDLTDRELVERFPWIPWTEPAQILYTGDRNTHYACRLCIAHQGLAGPDIPSLPIEPGPIGEHIRREHPEALRA